MPVLTPDAIHFSSKRGIFFLQNFSTLCKFITLCLVPKDKVESGLININKGNHWRIIYTCFLNLDRRADSLLDCFLFCLLSSLSSWTRLKRKDHQWQCTKTSRKRRNTKLKEIHPHLERKKNISLTEMTSEKSDDLLICAAPLSKYTKLVGAQHYVYSKGYTSLEAYLLCNLDKKWNFDAGILGGNM